MLLSRLKLVSNLLLAGKYKSTSDLEKAYVELQQRLGEGPVEEETPEPEEQGEEPEAEEEEASDEAGDMTQEQAEILMGVNRRRRRVQPYA